MKIVGTISNGEKVWEINLDVDPSSKTMTVGELYNLISFPASKLRDYIRSGKVLYPLHNEDIQRVTVAQWQAAVDTQNSPYGRKLAKSIISKIYKAAIKNGIRVDNLSSYIDVEIPPSKSRIVIDQSTEKKLWDYYNNTGNNVIGCVLIMLYTGMRPCEMRDVKLDCIKDNVIYNAGHKTDKGRVRPIIIPEKIMGIVKNEFEKNGGLLTNLNTAAFNRQFCKIRTELRLPSELVPYCARHTYATRLAEAGVSPLIITDLMGHTTVNMSHHYTHICVEAMRSAVDKIALPL